MNKTVKIMLGLMVCIVLTAAVTFVVLDKFSKPKGDTEQTIDEVLEVSYDVPEVTTNLLSGEFVKIKFKIQMSSKKAKEEIEKRDFQVNNVIIQELVQMTHDDVREKNSIPTLESVIKNKVNELMKSGSVVRVYTTSIMVQ
ncbi:flagellar basal body-associated protein FliL [Priestia taiwanensis]|uniref:Flagellar protein FliL n=1 Tax=Priestia taiwanensis TaxID=1347902 RepID=A0A917EN65_9BACI|nr:flagellar basal body-associated protein FliL [Priestia taiwanensis]MBM7362834.1 flagellar FliL protein [Priestia taiwanensis]GGE65481.1 flagellar protein FliL [Priestia taiwanensis]